MTSRWRRMFGRSAEPVAMAAPRPSAKFSLNLPSDLVAAMTGGGNIAAPISRNEALQVPAVLRARNLICGSIGTLPIRVHDPKRKVVTDVQYLVNSPPDPDVAQSVVMAQTVEDLFFYSVAWWRVTKWGWHGYPVEARWVPHSSVLVAPSRGLPPSRLIISPDELFPTPDDGGVVYIDGRPVDDNEVIRFDSPNPPLLRHSARAIRTCLQLDQTANLYAADPLPLGYFAPQDDAQELPDDEVQEILDDWETARRQRAWGYVSGALKAQTLQWSPEQLQLASARQHAVLEIARAAGVDPEDLGVSTTSRTYKNNEDRRQDLIDFTLGPYVSAIQDRLSMRDVLPRGYTARIDFAGFLRGDTKTRMETYQVGLQVGAYTDDEIRELEDRPPLTPAQRAANKPAPPAAAAPPADQTPPASAAGAQQHRHRQEEPVTASTGRQQFAGTRETVRVRFTAEMEHFQVDTARRTITGLMLPWDVVADNGAGKWRFAKGSVVWSDPSRVKLNLDHTNNLIGVATRLQAGNAGLTGTFKLGRSSDADRALQDAEDGILDGISVEVDFEHPDSVAADPADRTVNLVRNATLRGAALTGTPAFDDARLTSVKASRNQGGNMPDNTGTTTAPAPAESFDFQGHLTAAVDRMAETHERLTASLAESLGESFSTAMRTALEDLPNPQNGNGPQPVRAARYTITREAPVYSFDGRGHSLVRDAWYAIRERDDDALERIRKFRVQTTELAKVARDAVSFMSARRERFATSTTSSAGQLIPPGYRPELFVPMLNQQRPLANALSQGTIENATPFVVPVFGSFSGATVDNVEGVNPTDGSLTFTTKTVTPGAISGRLVLSREIVDSSNPAIDQIALNSMRESYARQTEGKVYTELNGPNGLGGTLTPGTAEALSTNPNGAYCIQTADGTALKLPVAIRRLLANYPFKRFASPNSANIGQIPTSALATATGSDNRPLFPSVGAMNDSGIGNAVQQGWYVDGMPFVPAWSVSGVVGSNDTHVIIMNSLDAWMWESPTLLFRFEEKQGPALIELALFGYFATHVLRPIGLAGIRMTAP